MATKRVSELKFMMHRNWCLFDLEVVRNCAQLAFPLCFNKAIKGSPLTTIDSLEVSIVSDAEIAKVHEKFMDDPSPTDVITFDYGGNYI